MDDLFAYKRLESGQGNLEIPERSENRKPTDFPWLVVFGISLLVAIPFGLYASATVDLSNIINGTNVHDPDEVINNNVTPTFNVGTILGLALIPIALCVVMMLLYRYATAVTVWGQLILGLAVFTALTIYIWVTIGKLEKQEDKDKYISAGISITVVLVIYLIVAAVLFRKIPLVVRLFNEATKCIFDMPEISLIPIVSAIIQQLFVVMYILTIIWIANKQVNALLFPVVFLYIWHTQVILGVQYMVISGAVAHWYFARDRPRRILTSVWNTFRYHMGTICLGGLIIAIIATIKMILKSLSSNKFFKACIDICIGSFESLVEFISNNAYIETAIHGEPFIKSGKRAVKLLSNNLGKMIAINYVGSFVLMITFLIIFGVTLGSSYAVFQDSKNLAPAMVVMAVITAVVVFCFFGVFKTTIDALFICYCEDITLNDGRDQPYHMSENFSKFVDDAKRFYVPAGHQTPIVA